MGDSQQSNEGEVSSVEPTEVSVTPPEEGKEQQQVDEFAKLLESELPIPEVPTTDTNSPLPSPDALNRYRTALYNYYIQYYARHYIKQLRSAYVQHFPETEMPTCLSVLPPPTLPPPDDQPPVTDPSQLEKRYEDWHLSFNSQANQVYQSWYMQQFTWITQSAAQQQQAAENAESSESTSADPTADYVAHGYFNKKSNRFQATTSEAHWQAKGLPEDRQGRQMAMFFDVDAYQESKRKAANKPIKKQSAKYWKQKKAERKRKKLLDSMANC